MSPPHGGTAGGAIMGNTGGAMRVQAAARRNTALAWLVEESLAMPRRVETVLQVPPGTTYSHMGMGGQSGAVEKATRSHRRRTKILSAVPFC
jgi:hypothetical protein